MKLGAKEADGFLRAPGKAAGALIYGNDGGQVRQRVAVLAESWLGPNADAMAKMEFAAEQIKDDPALLADELAAMSLMADKRVIQVREADDSILAAVEEALTHRAPSNLLILYANESLAGSKLRSFAERSSDLGCVPCYKDEGMNLEALIRDTLRGYGLRAANDVTRYIATQLSGDRQIILNELEKLSLYLDDEAEEVTLEDAQAAIGENNDRSIDDLCQAIAVGNIPLLCRLSDRLISEGNVGVVLVRAVMRYIARLEHIHALRAQHNASIDAAIEMLRPPVFFKAKPPLKQAAARWNATACADALAKLQMLELDSKRFADQAMTRMAHGFMEIAALPQQGRKAA
jgi:DNA polymerase-3 subunit delta